MVCALSPLAASVSPPPAGARHRIDHRWVATPRKLATVATTVRVHGALPLTNTGHKFQIIKQTQCLAGILPTRTWTVGDEVSAARPLARHYEACIVRARSFLIQLLPLAGKTCCTLEVVVPKQKRQPGFPQKSPLSCENGVLFFSSSPFARQAMEPWKAKAPASFRMTEFPRRLLLRLARGEERLLACLGRQQRGTLPSLCL